MIAWVRRWWYYRRIRQAMKLFTSVVGAPYLMVGEKQLPLVVSSRFNNKTHFIIRHTQKGTRSEEKQRPLRTR